MLYAKFGLGQSSDCPAQRSDPSFVRAIPGLSSARPRSTNVLYTRLCSLLLPLALLKLCTCMLIEQFFWLVYARYRIAQ